MSESEVTTGSEEPSTRTQLRRIGAGLLRYVEDNPLAAVAGALIVGVILARFAFLGNPKDE